MEVVIKQGEITLNVIKIVSYFYFFVEFDRPAVKQFTWQNNNVSNKLKASGKNSGASFVFDTKNEKYVNYKISISYVSVENAKLNMISDGLEFDFDSYMNKNQIAWNKALNKIQVESANRDKKVQFYSSLYRSFIHPNIVSDINELAHFFDIEFTIENNKLVISNVSRYDTTNSLIRSSTFGSGSFFAEISANSGSFNTNNFILSA